MRKHSSAPTLTSLFLFFGKISGIFHYFNESFVIDQLNDFERHFAWLSKTSLPLKIGQSPWKLCMVEYLSVSVWFWDFTNLSFPTVFVAFDPLPLATKGFAAKPSLIWRRGSQNTHGQFPRARWWLSRSETARIPFLADWPRRGVRTLLVAVFLETRKILIRVPN